MSHSGLVEFFRGKKLDDTVKAILAETKGNLTPDIKDFRPAKDLQQQLLPGFSTVHSKDTGDFYELFAKALYGGELNLSERVDYPGQSRYRIQKPDLVGEYFEMDIKGLERGTTLKLEDSQIVMYHERQMMYPEKQIGHLIFRHTVKGMTKQDGATRGMVQRRLSKETAYGMYVPESIMTAFWLRFERGLSYRSYPMWLFGDSPEKGYLELDNAVLPDVFKKSKKTGRMVKNNEAPHSGVKSSTLHSLFLNPEGVIEKLDMDPSLFTFERTYSPKEIYIDRKRVGQFPMLIIKDKHPILWLNYLLNALKPENRFSDSDMSVVGNMELIQGNYLDFVATNRINGSGYWHKPREEARRRAVRPYQRPSKYVVNAAHVQM